MNAETASDPTVREDYEDNPLQKWLKIKESVSGVSDIQEFSDKTFEHLLDLCLCKDIIIGYDETGSKLSPSSIFYAHGMRGLPNTDDDRRKGFPKTKAGKDIIRLANVIAASSSDKEWIPFEDLPRNTEFSGLGRMYGSAVGAPIRFRQVKGIGTQCYGAVIVLWGRERRQVPPVSQITQMLPDYARLCLQIKACTLLQPFVWSPSSKMETIRADVEEFARTQFSILILGERGTGKTALASEVHRLSGRQIDLFWQIPCSTYCSDLLEVILFGCKKGAYTGAESDRPGVFEIYDGGTVFLDEIANTAITTQQKLLHFLQTKTYTRYGDSVPRESKVRLIFATNESLKVLGKPIGEGFARVRLDFLERIKGPTVVMPTLDERKSTDVYILANHFLTLFNRQHGSSLVFSDDAMKMLKSIEYGPGNIHVLEKYIQLAYAFALHAGNREIADGDIVRAESNREKIRDWEPRPE